MSNKYDLAVLKAEKQQKRVLVVIQAFSGSHLSFFFRFSFQFLSCWEVKFQGISAGGSLLSLELVIKFWSERVVLVTVWMFSGFFLFTNPKSLARNSSKCHCPQLLSKNYKHVYPVQSEQTCIWLTADCSLILVCLQKCDTLELKHLLQWREQTFNNK